MAVIGGFVDKKEENVQCECKITEIQSSSKEHYTMKYFKVMPKLPSRWVLINQMTHFGLEHSKLSRDHFTLFVIGNNVVEGSAILTYFLITIFI